MRMFTARVLRMDIDDPRAELPQYQSQALAFRNTIIEAKITLQNQGKDLAGFEDF
jgi:hypothetical protein